MKKFVERVPPKCSGSTSLIKKIDGRSIVKTNCSSPTNERAKKFKLMNIQWILFILDEKSNEKSALNSKTVTSRFISNEKTHTQISIKQFPDRQKRPRVNFDFFEQVYVVLRISFCFPLNLCDLDAFESLNPNRLEFGHSLCTVLLWPSVCLTRPIGPMRWILTGEKPLSQ